MLDIPATIPIIPMKPLSEGKTRLARQLTKDQRAELIAGMLRRVISAIKGASIELFWVIGGDERVMQLTRNNGGLWLEELGRNLNDTVTKGFERACQQGNAALYMPGDLPFIKPSDVTNLLRSSERGNNITLAPARRDGGTNGIVVPHGIPFVPELGQRSFAKHLAQAAAKEISVSIYYSQGLGFDLDTIDDLESYEHMESGLLKRLVPLWEGPTGN
ncbi:MAG: 2-phospho-L-lactate guanylyltransferase [SAR202 cluster bacterium Casp-Chloro-G3]|nr:MAG: 2-phospho-L-lactate guanylyltransferase [SAR202 cluster bacterium Casp-Chloro-G3]